ncbi:MAG: sigma-54 dependent transcriptional regulator [Candidatus Omnitrophica bacterium]|nr:sigma-54 dependent transcriptional regulator [Candidatus Omnitrophota bacterium]MBU1047254.1 sigma-54 dependent transcriptional regulator [Candidatus Omnitrophota bacterium]MBU1630299.1 sigma-54 dependent transcriptional regulator [Candidatus Omnitrophota bacterium]MBU1766900.1 sigma-54 dependent transcriptional regulator [Candidatus Omnitrophota bacterium]MBU1889161.1 sigma-54 dependent transcriptional regulator [Candidatus Omnitrophota bacterium]
MKKKILIVENESRQAKLWMTKLEGEGYKVSWAENGKVACDKILKENYQLILTDIRMPQMDGLELLDWIREKDKEIPVIIITAFADVDSAVRAMKRGAYDYVKKPMDLEELTQIIGKVFRMKILEEENVYLKKELSRKSGMLVVGESYEFKKVMDLIARVAKTKSTVLITGETGTGKELVANAIHYNSPRKNAPLIVVNCAALPENLLESEFFGHVKGAFTGAYEDKKGKFAVASSGTLFLDEIGAIPINLQSKLLRAIENQQFEPVGSTKTVFCDVRIIAATNVDLKKAIEKNEFREDLYYRINVFPIYLPALRQRVKDIPYLVEHFIKMYNIELKKEIKDIQEQVLDILTAYSWPGNVRELENIIERAMVLCEKDILTTDLFKMLENKNLESRSPLLDVKSSEEFFVYRNEQSYSESKRKFVSSFDKNFILKTLKEAKGNITKASNISGIDRKNLYRKIKSLKINPKTFKEVANREEN